jgi:hypothetical protein
MRNQCQGRKTTPKSAPLFFETGPRLHRSKPLSYLGIVRCLNEADDLCAACLDRQKATAYQLEKRAGKYIPNQETMFHGRVGEPIPKWSRLQGGEWFQAQIAAGYTVGNTHKEIVTDPVEMGDVVAPVIKKVVRRKKVAPPAESTETPEPVAAPVVAPVAATIKKREPKKVGVAPEPRLPLVTMLHTTSGFVGREEAKREEVKPPVKPKRTKKTVATPAVATPEITEVVPIPMEEVKPVAKPKRSIKKVIKPKTPVIGIVEVAADDIPVTKIHVKKEEIAGRSVYVAETKDKVYDLSYSYLGRWNRKEGRIETTFPDSDAEP